MDLQVIAGVVVVVIVGLIVLTIVIVNMRSQRQKYEFNPLTKPAIHTEFHNPLYGPMKGTLSTSNELNYNEENNYNDSYLTYKKLAN